MVLRVEGYYGPSPDDLGRGALAMVVLAAVSAVMFVVLCVMPIVGAGETDDGEDPTARVVGSGFSIDPGDHKAMHDANLPTRSDVLGWHMCGRWGFPRDGEDGYEVHIFHDLPGGAWVWDALYGFNPDDPRFKFKEASPYEG